MELARSVNGSSTIARGLVLASTNGKLFGRKRQFSTWKSHASVFLKALSIPIALRSFGRGRLPHFACLSISGGGGPNIGGGQGSGGGGGGGDGFQNSALSTNSMGGEPEDAGSKAPIVVLDVGGMSCGGCAASVKRILESQATVESATVNLATETAVVQLKAGVSSDGTKKEDIGAALATHLTTCGFKSALRGKGEQALYTAAKKKEERLLRMKESGRRLAAAWALLSVCVVGHASHFGGPPWLHAFHSVGFQMSVCMVSLIGPGRKLISDGLRSLLRNSPNMNTLVGLGAVSSFAVSVIAAFLPKLGWQSFFEEPVMLLAFVMLGRAIEERSKLKASSDMETLLNFLPKKARLVMGQSSDTIPPTVEIPCEDIVPGDNVVVLPGDHIPVDGVVKQGRSTIDQSSLTGESLPVLKIAGVSILGLGFRVSVQFILQDEVNAGTVNHNGVLLVEAKRAGSETVLADIVRIVESAQTREAPVQRLADKVAGQFTYGVMGLSAATLGFWSTLGPKLFPSVIPAGGAFLLGLQLACNVLVIACPCALGLATPTAVLVGTSLGARKGLLIRGGDILEKASAIDTVVFDKTGTLTYGRPVITAVLLNDIRNGASPPWSKQEVWSLASGIECKTSHPLAKAIVQAAQDAGCKPAMIEEASFEQEPGSGATGIVQGRKVSVGTLEWIQRQGARGIPPDLPQSSKDQTVVYVGVDERIAAAICMVDEVREDAAETITSLKKLGISAFMLSGDKREVAEAVARKVGIDSDKVYPEVKPLGKAELVQHLQDGKRVVAMVGDGINDAAALARSDVGIAMATGIGAATEVASIVLMRDKLYHSVDAIELSRIIRRKIRQNLWWAFMYNIVGLPVAAGALLPAANIMLTPSLSGALMGMSSIGVMANSLLLHWEYGNMTKRSQSKSDPVYNHPAPSIENV